MSHIGFRRALKAQGIDHHSLPFIAHFAPWLQYGGLVVLTFILGCLFYLSIFPFGGKGSAETFFSTYLAAPLFVFDYIVYKVNSEVLSRLKGELTAILRSTTKQRLLSLRRWTSVMLGRSMKRIVSRLSRKPREGK